MDFSVVGNLLDKIKSLLPTSPFDRFIGAMGKMPFLEYLNYFIPISQMIAIGEAWLAAIALYYVYSIVLRWIKAIS